MLLAAMNAPETDTAVWQVERSLSKVSFAVTHLGITSVRGQFHDFEVNVHFDPEDWSTISVDGTVKVASLDTGNRSRDEDIQSDFFGADRYPEMTFKSKRVEKVGGNKARLIGDLTIRHSAKEVAFDVKQLSAARIDGENHIAMEVRTSIGKKDLVGQLKEAIRGVNALIGFDVQITMGLELVQVTPKGGA